MSKIAFLFPGQGAQHVGMGQKIAAEFPAAQRLFDSARDILGYDLAALCFQGPQEKLDTTEISQPAIYVASLAALEMLKQRSPEVVAGCELAAGLSLGEYTALVFAGAMSFEDGLKLVQQRGRAMQAASDATPSGMVSVLMLERPVVEEIVRQASEAGPIWIANHLCPGNLVVSGSKAACARVVELAEQQRGQAKPLSVAGAFHTNIMKPADETLAGALAQVAWKSPRIPVISNVDTESHTTGEAISRTLVKQVVSPVLWEDSIRKLLAQGVTKFYEIGPGKVLKGLMKRIDRKVEVETVNDSN